MHELLLITSIACVLLNSAVWAQSDALTYEYTSPYRGAGQLTIYNDSDETITLDAVSFLSNAKVLGTPWGTLWGWQSKINTQDDPDKMHYLSKIDERPLILIKPKSSAYLTYQLDLKHLGGAFNPNNLAMDPSQVQVTLQDSQGPIVVPIRHHCVAEACQDPGHGLRIMGYYPNWAYWRTPAYTADLLPFDKMNTVGYAFAIFDNNGQVSLYDLDSDSVNLPIISQARKRYPYLNASLSFGGWSWSSTPSGWHCQVGSSPHGPAECFSQMAADPIATAAFVTQAVQAMKEVNFNGIDIDWEYPINPDDVKNYINLLQKLRIALDQQSQLDHQIYFLTTAVPGGIDKINALTASQWQTVASVTDFMGVMTYDFHGPWDQGHTGSNFMSAMQLDPAHDPSTQHVTLSKYNVTDAMGAYVTNGVASQKLLLGIPLYGRMVQIKQQGLLFGLYQPIIGTPQGEWDNVQSGFTGMIDYQCIIDQQACGNHYLLPRLTRVNPENHALGYYAKTPWGYSPDFFITYDDLDSAAYKATWVKNQQFGGVMLWDLTGDFKNTDSRSIINKIYQIFSQ